MLVTPQELELKDRLEGWVAGAKLPCADKGVLSTGGLREEEAERDIRTHSL